MIFSPVSVLLLSMVVAPGAQQQSSPSQVATEARASDRPAVSLRQLVADHNWLALENELEHSTDPNAAFYHGLLENRLGHYDRSIELLQPLLPTLTGLREKQARLALADDDFRLFRYREAVAAYAALNSCCAALLTESERADIEIPARLLPLLKTTPPQTLQMDNSFTVPVDSDPLGLNDVSVQVDGYPASWLFDPAANFTVLTRSQAKLIGLRLSGETLTVTGITGRAISVHATVIPQLRFGAALFRNVPAVVCEDADLYDKPHQYQIQGVLAQPLLAVLGQITLSDDRRLTISREALLKDGAPFFSDGEHLIVAAGAKGSEQLYVLDPGGTGSQLTSRYYDQHIADFAHARMQLIKLPEAGTLPIPAYTAESVNLIFGETPVTFHGIQLLAQSAGADRDRFFGILCEDTLEQLASYTFDFRTMRFFARPHPEQ